MAHTASALREIRTRLGLSQAECAMALGVALETFRTWDAGRRPAPEAIVSQARTLKAKRPPHDRVPLQVLADELHVHVRTLRAAAHDGRLAATFGPRPFFGKLTATATREAAAQFMATWYRRTYGRGRRRLVPVCRVTVPRTTRRRSLACGAGSASVNSSWPTRSARPARRSSTSGKAGSESLRRVLATSRATVPPA